MDRANILDEITAASRRILELIDANREASDDRDLDLSNRLRTEIRCLLEMREELLGKQPTGHNP
jgi:hypothetical protein